MQQNSIDFAEANNEEYYSNHIEHEKLAEHILSLGALREMHQCIKELPFP